MGAEIECGDVDTTKCVLGIGQALLDLVAHVPSEFLAEYGLELNNFVLADESKQGLFDRLVKEFQVDYVPGGAIMNTCRVVQGMLNRSQSAAFIGRIGDDSFGMLLAEKCAEEKLFTHFQKSATSRTGVCAVLVGVSGERSLCTALGASAQSLYELSTCRDAKKAIQDAVIIYMGSFLFNTKDGLKTILFAGQEAKKNGKVFALNLSAPWLVETFIKEILQVLPFADFVFCNESEAAMLGQVQNWGQDLGDIALKLATLPMAQGSKELTRTVVFTQGPHPTLVAYDGVLKEYPVPILRTEEIVDKNGCGDSFCGGFFASLAVDILRHKPISIDACVAAGHFAAGKVIQHSGCAL